MPATNLPWGGWRVTINEVDITMFRSKPISGRFTTVEPFGCAGAELVIPAITPLEQPGAGALAFLKRGAPVDIWWRDPEGGQTSVYSGEVGGWSPTLSSTQGRLPVSVVGDMEAASLQNWQPPAGMDPTDIGIVIRNALQEVVGRRYLGIVPVETGILTTYLGSDDQSVLAYCQELLSTAVTQNGRQWTVARVSPRQYAIQLKETGSVDWTVRAGQPGLEFNLSVDHTQAPTRIYGSGVTTDGYSWKNMFYPGAYQADGAPYPNTSPGKTIGLGDTDAGTDNGRGVTDLQTRLIDLGARGVEVDGKVSADDIDAIKAIQRDFGLTVDGVVGGQTWTAIWFVGEGQLGDAVRLPLAQIVGGRPTYSGGNGAATVTNPDFDPNTLTVDKDINFGGGVSKALGRKAALGMLARDYPAGMAGTITFRADPREGSRRLITAGQNISLLGAAGVNTKLHISQAEVDLEGPTTVTVDEKGRDILNLVQVIQRNRDNAVNPAGLPKSRFARRALLSGDTVQPFDGESPAGRIPELVLYSRLWTVIRIPCSRAGRIAKIALRTDPISTYCLSFFGAPIKPSDLNRMIGDPFTKDSPYEDAADEMREKYGWIESWGSSTDAPGLSPSGLERRWWYDEGTLEYRSVKPPYIWIAFFANRSTRISGRLFPAPLDA